MNIIEILTYVGIGFIIGIWYPTIRDKLLYKKHENPRIPEKV